MLPSTFSIWQFFICAICLPIVHYFSGHRRYWAMPPSLMAELGHGIQHSQVTEQQHSSTGGQMKHWKEKCGHNDWQVIATAELSSADIFWAVCRLVAALWVSNEVLMMPVNCCCCCCCAVVPPPHSCPGWHVTKGSKWRKMFFGPCSWSVSFVWPRLALHQRGEKEKAEFLWSQWSR